MCLIDVKERCMQVLDVEFQTLPRTYWGAMKGECNLWMQGMRNTIYTVEAQGYYADLASYLAAVKATYFRQYKSAMRSELKEECEHCGQARGTMVPLSMLAEYKRYFVATKDDDPILISNHHLFTGKQIVCWKQVAPRIYTSSLRLFNFNLYYAGYAFGFYNDDLLSDDMVDFEDYSALSVIVGAKYLLDPDSVDHNNTTMAICATRYTSMAMTLVKNYQLSKTRCPLDISGSSDTHHDTTSDVVQVTDESAGPDGASDAKHVDDNVTASFGDDDDSGVFVWPYEYDDAVLLCSDPGGTRRSLLSCDSGRLSPLDLGSSYLSDCVPNTCKVYDPLGNSNVVWEPGDYMKICTREFEDSLLFKCSHSMYSYSRTAFDMNYQFRKDNSIDTGGRIVRKLFGHDMNFEAASILSQRVRHVFTYYDMDRHPEASHALVFIPEALSISALREDDPTVWSILRTIGSDVVTTITSYYSLLSDRVLENTDVLFSYTAQQLTEIYRFNEDLSDSDYFNYNAELTGSINVLVGGIYLCGGWNTALRYLMYRSDTLVDLLYEFNSDRRWTTREYIFLGYRILSLSNCIPGLTKDQYVLANRRLVSKTEAFIVGCRSLHIGGILLPDFPLFSY